jgi:hypothetical protein
MRNGTYFVSLSGIRNDTYFLGPTVIKKTKDPSFHSTKRERERERETGKIQ